MAKRKRQEAAQPKEAPNGKSRRVANVPAQSHIQIIAGSYERVLHGIIAIVPSKVLRSTEKEDGQEDTKKSTNGTSTEDKEDLEITFADSFLFNAHTSALRAIALSPIPAPDDPSQKVILATGATDEKINLYHISPSPPPPLKKGEVALPSLSGVKVSQNAWNRELGALLHHAGPITALHFPTRSKLLSAAEDNTIAVSRSRDWTVLSTIKAPIPKPFGRPSGDTAGPGEVPAGINDFAIHPSMKIMLSVGKGERCLRLWNLLTGKKAGVLSFERDMLQRIGEGKYGTGEGRKVEWDAEGEEFVVAFERGACVYDIDCKPKATVLPRPPTKVHQMCYVPGQEANVLALSTEDGRILFYETEPAPAAVNRVGEDEDEENDGKQKKKPEIPLAKLIAQLGGRVTGMNSRIKDFTVLSGGKRNTSEETQEEEGGETRNLILVTGGSDGSIGLWSLPAGELESAATTVDGDKEKIPQVGHLLAQYETGNRITCLEAFIMNARTDNGVIAEESEAEFNGFGANEQDSDSSDSDD